MVGRRRTVTSRTAAPSAPGSTHTDELPIATGEPPTSLATRNLLRHITWSQPSGQDIAAATGAAPLAAGDLAELQGYGVGLERSTPLWYYILAEAAHHGFELVVHDPLQIELLEAHRGAERFVLWIKMDTGMNRLGFRPEAFAAAHAGRGAHGNIPL